MDDAVTVLENSGNTLVAVLANDTGAPQAAASFTQGAHGSVTTGNGGLNYQPEAHFFGEDTFQYTLEGGSTATVSVTVTGVNDVPTFTVGMDLTVAEDAGDQSFPAWATAITPGPPNESSQVLAFTVVADHPELFASGPTVLSDGTLQFTTAADANGTTRLSVTLADNGGTDHGGVDTSPSQEFTLTVTEVNDAPVAIADTVPSIDEDSGPYDVSVQALLGNDAAGPPSESTQAVSVVGVLASVGGTASLAGGAVRFLPARDFHGEAGFTYLAADNGTTHGMAAPRTANATVTFTINPVNDPPTATNLTTQETYLEATPLNLADIVVTDVDSTQVTVTLTLSDATVGTLSTTTSGTVTATYDAAQGTWRASGDLVDVNAVLAEVTFVPAANVSSAFTINTSLDDGVAAAVSASKPMAGVENGITEVNDPGIAVADDGKCTLREAVTAANTHVPSGTRPGECQVGMGPVTITVPPGVVGFSGAPLAFTRSVTVVSTGPGVTHLDGGGTAAMEFRAGTASFQDCDLGAAALSVLGGAVVSLKATTGAANVVIAGTLDNAGDFHATSSMAITAQLVSNTSDAGISASGNLTVTTAGDFTNAGRLAATGSLDVTTAGTFTNTATLAGSVGVVTAGTGATLNAGVFLNNGTVNITGDLTITAAVLRNETPGGDTREWYRSFTGSDTRIATNAYYSFPDNYEIQYWSKDWTNSQRYVGGVPAFKPLLAGTGTLTLQGFNTGINIGSLISAVTVTLVGNTGATFNNNPMALKQENWRQSWEIYTHYIALGPATYDNHVRRNDDGGVLQGVVEISNLGAGVVATVINAGGFSL